MSSDLFCSLLDYVGNSISADLLDLSFTGIMTLLRTVVSTYVCRIGARHC